jgi:ABC-type antimicrobial peptide transport system permease subunit
VRTQGPPDAIIHAARQVLASLAPGLPFSKVETMHEQISESLWQERLVAALAGVFSVFSLLMAGMGLYALLAYDATQRTREFGIRTAVGAQRRDLVILLLKELVQIVLPGLAIGLVACLFLARLIASALYGIKPLDPVSLVGALLVVGVIGFISAWQPICYATKVDPAIVLREE